MIIDICNECTNYNGKFFCQFDKNICEDCLKLNKYTLYKRIYVMKKYLLSDDEFYSLPVIYKKAGWQPIKYITRHELINYLCEKYNIINKNDYIQNNLNIDDYMIQVKNDIRKNKLKIKKENKLNNI
jgi:hypothetical protein